MKRIALATSAAVLALLVGCAAGSEDDAGLGESNLESQSSDEDAGGASLPMPSNTEDEDADAGAPTGDAGGGDAGGGNTGGNGGGGTTPSACTATNTCGAGAQDLGTVSGDTGADVKTATGSTSKWFKVKVTEDDSSPDGVKLWAKVTLTSPPGANFDLFVYQGTGSTQECSTVAQSSSTTATTDTASLQFGEGGILSNGKSDDTWLTVEVRAAAGTTCSSNATWSLTVAGNQN